MCIPDRARADSVNERQAEPTPTCPMHPGSRVHRYRARGPKGPGIYLQCVPEGDGEAHLLSWPEEASDDHRQVELSLTEIEVLRDAADGLTIDETAERRSKSAADRQVAAQHRDPQAERAQHRARGRGRDPRAPDRALVAARRARLAELSSASFRGALTGADRGQQRLRERHRPRSRRTARRPLPDRSSRARPRRVAQRRLRRPGRRRPAGAPRARAAADGDHERRAVAGADEDVVRAGRAVEVVPLPQRAAPRPRRAAGTRPRARGSPPGPARGGTARPAGRARRRRR